MNKVRIAVCSGFLAVAGTVTADTQRENVVTLYRNSVLDNIMRIHVATFDAEETNPNYNSDNCQVAARLFQSQTGASARYWCEPGRFQPDWK